MKAVISVLALALAISLAGFAGSASASPISRYNAVRTAKEYISSMPFSRSGLVKQLKFEGYSSYDAAWGANHSGANWWTQARKMAREYISTMPFSRSSLISQLEFEGFSYAQAVYGVRAVGY